MDAEKQLAEIIEKSDNIVFLGGAGVSTESNIPDFRSEDGIFKAVQVYGQPPEVLLSHTFFMQNTEIFYDYYKKYLLFPAAEPNDAHRALAELEKRGKLKAVVTQNIDGLHQRAGSREVLELHGSVYRNHCMDCGAFYSLEEMLALEGVIPHCPQCGGIVKPDVVLYEEGLNERLLDKACAYIANADVFIVGGTSLVVYPAAGLVNYYKGKKLILINKSQTPYDRYANLILHESIGKALRPFL